jgi:hypothetical protein
MEKDDEKYVFSIDTGENSTADEFNVEIFEYNHEMCCEGNPRKIIKNFDELINLLDEWEE